MAAWSFITSPKIPQRKTTWHPKIRGRSGSCMQNSLHGGRKSTPSCPLPIPISERIPAHAKRKPNHYPTSLKMNGDSYRQAIIETIRREAKPPDKLSHQARLYELARRDRKSTRL